MTLQGKGRITANAPQNAYVVKKWKDNQRVEAIDCLAEEVPIALVYNGVSHAVMLATPQDLEDFALGFSLTEGILQHKSELYDIEIVEQTNGIELQLNVATERFEKLKAQHGRAHGLWFMRGRKFTTSNARATSRR